MKDSSTIEIKTDLIRYCGQCFGILFPTDEYAYQGSHRFWQCPICGFKMLWVSHPKLDGSYAQLHKYADGHGFSSISMLNDPTCDVFGPPKLVVGKRTRTTPPPETTEEGMEGPLRYAPGQRLMSQEARSVQERPMYVIGNLSGMAVYSWTNGPTPNLQDMLDSFPENEKEPAFIVECINNNQYTKIYRWHRTRGEWIRI